jgi:hypothetical protein
MAKVLAHISKNATSEEIKLTLNKIASSKKKKNISKHFGALKRNIDGLEYQKKCRDEWS